MRVLGIDPGLTRCGVGVVDGPVGAPVFVDGQCIRTDKDAPIEQRLLRLREGIAALIALHRPDQVAVERVLFQVNVRTAMATGQAAGIALLAAAEAGLAVVAYSPNEVKLAVAGHGAADKGAVARMVAAQLRLSEPPRPADVADALAVALTHLGRSRQLGAAGASPASGAGGWEGALANRGLRVLGGTSPRDLSPRDSSPRSPSPRNPSSGTQGATQ
ncbi:MAG: crossover junction endodeoxyribonuclease RuvC [Glaciecola sp.]